MELLFGIIGLVLLIIFYMMLSDIKNSSKEIVRLLKKLNNEVEEPKPESSDRKTEKSWIQ